MSDHTPGPWSYFIDPKTRQGHIYGANNFKIHDLFNGTTEAGSIVEANAALIAASPDLLKASQLILSSFAYAPGKGPEWYEAARMAVGKATVDAVNTSSEQNTSREGAE